MYVELENLLTLLSCLLSEYDVDIPQIYDLISVFNAST